jgi:hypothetical protein
MNEHYGVQGYARHDINYSEIDHKAINDGFQQFWMQCQLYGFERNEDGTYKRDENGRLIPVRSNKPRMKPKTFYDYFENL